MKVAFPLCLIICLPFFADAAVIFVDDNASPGGDGSSWSNAHKYLQDALSAASSGDEIRVAEGTYKPDRGTGKTQGDRTASFNLVSDVEIYGGFLGTEATRDQQGDGKKTILSGDITNMYSEGINNYPVHLEGLDENIRQTLEESLWSNNVIVAIGVSNTALDSFLIQRGNANSGYGGGAIFARESTITLSDCFFENNRGIKGGAIHSEDSSIIATNCIFKKNSSEFSSGGAVYAEGFLPKEGILRPTSLWISSNLDQIHKYYQSHYFTNCVFADNTSSEHGGAVSAFAGGHFFFTNCVFSHNICSFSGGGCYSINTPSTFLNCTFSNNSAGTLSAIAHVNDYPLVITNCILQGNKEGGGSFESHGIEAQPEDQKKNLLQGIGPSPMLVNPDDPDGPDDIWLTNDDGLRLEIGSPAIDTANLFNQEPKVLDYADLDGDGLIEEEIPFDVMGSKRLVGGGIDFGAYEADPLNIPPLKYWKINTGFSNEFNNQTELYSLEGNVSGSGYYKESEVVEIKAFPNMGYVFSHWIGDANGSMNPLVITANSIKTISPVFVKDILVTESTKHLGNSWFQSMWLGTFYRFNNLWIYHTELGWIYIESSLVESLWLHINRGDLGWLWTKEDTYPFFYKSSTNSWLYFKSGHEKPRFYDYGKKEWITIE